MQKIISFFLLILYGQGFVRILILKYWVNTLTLLGVEPTTSFQFFYTQKGNRDLIIRVDHQRRHVTFAYERAQRRQETYYYTGKPRG